jgi:hypothetical protein
MASAKIDSRGSFFLQLLEQWDFDVPLTTQWNIVITPNAGNNLFNTINKYINIDLKGFSIPYEIQKRLLGETTQPNVEGLGLYFAQTVKLPRESFTPNHVGIDGMNGYLKGVVGGDRTDMSQRTLETEFLETNLDFSDGIIKPWIITASYKGLIELDSSSSIKSTITISEYTKATQANKINNIRKKHIFTGCVPTDVSDKTKDYDGEEIIKNSVSWLYESYSYQLYRYSLY